MSSKVLIKDVSIWQGDGFSPATDLLISEGRIARIGHGLSDSQARLVEAEGWLALPGLVDLHAHLGEPGHEEKENLESGLVAAAAGGFTYVLAMPDTQPPVDTEATAQFVRQRAKLVCGANLLVCGALTKGRAGSELAELAHLVEAGAVALGDARPLGDPSLLRRGLQYATMLGVPLLAQTGDETLAQQGVVHDGDVGHWLGLPGIPASAEWITVARELLIAEEVHGRIHVQGISTARSVELIREAKRRGVKVTVEANLYNLLLDDESLGDYDTCKKLTPPLRPAEDVQAVIAAIEEGLIDCIVTDHTPCTREEKEAEFDLAPFGAVGLELALSALHTMLIKPGKLSWSALIQALSVRPRRIVGLPQAELVEGAECDLTLFASEEPYCVEPAAWRSRSQNTPLAGVTLKGKVQGTLIGGRLLGPCFEEWPQARGDIGR